MTGVQTCALPISLASSHSPAPTTPATAPKSGATVTAPISEVRITSASATLPANGLGKAVITVSAVDAEGHPTSGLVRLQTSAGQLLSAVPSDVWQGRLGATRQQPSADPCSTMETGAETPQAFRSTTLPASAAYAATGTDCPAF